MAYRNGTYVAFHAEGSSDPTASDIKYYRMMLAWHANDGSSFSFYNSHDKVAAVRDSSVDETIKRSLRERLDNSKNMVLIVGQRTRFDTDFVPYEINYAAGTCGIPIIAAYPGQGIIRNPSALSSLWPKALADRIANGTASVIHVPFHQKTIENAIGQFSHNQLPSGGGTGIYSDSAYRSFGFSV
ncbi:TIR domain-containing protein [Sphingomonas bacterium]|uniref:TIR domain-containing protein n=1 Tax=Sphingomonas bacterium TaxID=1895847 RepID=UPI0026028ABA|nr:TIR domain-containing protein [Sphingomonas bacterium]MDB5678385.1 hypothetical protein [Sphingomonas bacterium]